MWQSASLLLATVLEDVWQELEAQLSNSPTCWLQNHTFCNDEYNKSWQLRNIRPCYWYCIIIGLENDASDQKERITVTGCVTRGKFKTPRAQDPIV